MQRNVAPGVCLAFPASPQAGLPRAIAQPGPDIPLTQVDGAQRGQKPGQHLGVDVLDITGYVAASDLAGDASQRWHGHANRGYRPLRAIDAGTSHQLPPYPIMCATRNRLAGQQSAQLGQRDRALRQLLADFPAVDRQLGRGLYEQLEDLLGDI
jgi:hypothetical protein